MDASEYGPAMSSDLQGAELGQATGRGGKTTADGQAMGGGRRGGGGVGGRSVQDLWSPAQYLWSPTPFQFLHN